MIVISDTSVITNLIKIQHLRLLQQLYQKVVIPQSVYEELAVLGRTVTQLLNKSWISVQSVENQADVETFQLSPELYTLILRMAQE